MSDSIKQSLSALMDDEVGEFELRKTLKQLDPSAADVWSRYHLLQAVLWPSSSRNRAISSP